MNMPLVSLLVPIYGVEKFIEKCAVSLFEQTYSNIEYVFVDDCTPDNSISVLRDIIAEYPGRKSKVRILHHEYNRGLAAARNTAIENAVGEYVMHVDSDDYLDIYAVEKSVNLIRKENADALMFGMKHVFANKKVNQCVKIPIDVKEYVKQLIQRECAVCVCGGIYRRSLYFENGVRAIEGVNMGEDYATKPRLIYYAKKVVYINEPLYNYVHYNNGAYTASFADKSIRDQKDSIDILVDFFNNVPDKEEFVLSLKKAALQIKAELLISWGLYGGNKKAWNDIIELYQGYGLELVSMKYRIILILAQWHLPRVVRVYSRIGVGIKTFFK